MLGDLGNDGVAESSQSVHPSGNPMSHSTHVGFNCPRASQFGFLRPFELGSPDAVGVGYSFTTAFSGRLFRRYCDGPPSFDASCVVGVGHIPCRAIVSSDGRTAAPSEGDWFDP